MAKSSNNAEPWVEGVMHLPPVVIARARTKAGPWVETTMNTCHGEERSDVAIHLHFTKREARLVNQLDPHVAALLGMTNWAQFISKEAGRLWQSIWGCTVACRSRFGSFAMTNKVCVSNSGIDSAGRTQHRLQPAS